MKFSSQAVRHQLSAIERPDGLCRSERLVVFARHPEPGKVKTRLAQGIGPHAAAAMHFALANQTLSMARRFGADHHIDLELRLAGNRIADFGPFDCGQIAVRNQQGTGLGERLSQAARTAFSEGVRKLAFIGTDCPDITPQILEQAYSALAHADVVIGPALDGGYYLLAIRKYLPGLFEGIDWGSSLVGEQTKAKAKQLGLAVAEIRGLSDVDFIEDLIVCRKQPERFQSILPQVQSNLLSIVIPTLNEQETLATTLQPLADCPGLEVIIADGGSTDRTLEIASQFKATVVPGSRGRGRQMNAGAALSRGEALLFLHADTILPTNFHNRVWQVLQTSAIAGAFRLGIDAPRSGLRLVEAGANFRSKYLQMPYGDQALFLRSQTFFDINGFRNWPLMEDYDLCRRLRQQGEIQIAPEAVATSSRRWDQCGTVRCVLTNQLLILAFRLGISPERLARLYCGSRSHPYEVDNEVNNEPVTEFDKEVEGVRKPLS